MAVHFTFTLLSSSPVFSDEVSQSFFTGYLPSAISLSNESWQRTWPVYFAPLCHTQTELKQFCNSDKSYFWKIGFIIITDIIIVCINPIFHSIPSFCWKVVLFVENCAIIPATVGLVFVRYRLARKARRCYDKYHSWGRYKTVATLNHSRCSLSAQRLWRPTTHNHVKTQHQILESLLYISLLHHNYCCVLAATRLAFKSFNNSRSSNCRSESSSFKPTPQKYGLKSKQHKSGCR